MQGLFLVYAIHGMAFPLHINIIIITLTNKNIHIASLDARTIFSLCLTWYGISFAYSYILSH